MPTRRLTIDCGSPDSEVIGNRFSSVSCWAFEGTSADEQMWFEWAEARPAGWLREQYPWIEEVQIYAASGGAARLHERGENDLAICEFDRDCFKEPTNRALRDDYDFARLLRACRNILRQGVRPCLKLHSVPLKLSRHPRIGWFRVNARPPEDYAEYALYLENLVRALVKEFGMEQVGQWRWFIGTEMENRNWWEAEDAAASAEEYCRFHDWSVEALSRVLGDKLGPVGAHAMMQGGIWNPEVFIAHCQSGLNRATGEKGSRLDFFAISYYDRAPGFIETDEWQTNLTGEGGDLARLPDAVARTRSVVSKHGFANIPIEVSEGGLLFGMDGKWLWHGLAPGGTFDASWTARLFHLMNDNDLALWARWPLLRTGGLFEGAEAASTHALRMIYSLAESRRLPTQEGSAIAALDADETVRIFLYNHGPDMTQPPEEVEAELVLMNLPWSGVVQVSTRTVDSEHGDFWKTWEADRQRAGITDEDFFRSRDQLDVAHALKNPMHRAYWEARLPGYEALAAYPEARVAQAKTESGNLSLNITLSAFSVALVEITNQ